MVILLIAPWSPLSQLQMVLLATGLVFFTVWIFAAIREAENGRIGACVGRLIAGIVLVDALALLLISWTLAAVCLVLLPVTLLLQRRIPAT
jgi:hypothetical protein